MHTFRLAPIFRERLAPLRPLAGGEGGTRRGSDGRVRWVAPPLGTARIPRLTPTLSAPKGGEGDISATCPAVRSVHALASSRGCGRNDEFRTGRIFWHPAYARR